MKIRVTTLWCFVLTALPLVVHADEVARCDGLYRFTDFSNAVEPGVLVAATDEVPAHCRVRGVIDGTIRFEVTMPVDGWQRRLWFHAVGGSAGFIGDTTSMLADGFAMASTDTGHEGNTPDANQFWRNELAVINYGYRSIHLTTVLAKQLINGFYGEENQHAYIWGCSNGGRTVFNELLRFPDDFDGAIAGAPTIDLVRDLLPWNVAGSRMQNKHPLTLESLALLDANSRARCDLLDDVEDRVIGTPQACTNDVLRLEKLQCEEGQTQQCLNAGQIKTARLMYEGIVDEAGHVVSPGVYPGGEGEGDWMLWVTGNPAFMPISANEAAVEIVEHLYYRDPSFDLEAFDVVHDRQELAELAVAVDPPAGDFSRFRNSGGKLIIYQGWSDYPVRADRLLKYLDEGGDLMGGPEKMADFHRLYMVPGMLHCTGGPGAWAADYVQPIVDWVENGKAPNELVATQPGITNWFEASGAVGAGGGSVDWYHKVMQAGAAKAGAKQFTRPLCPYPEFAQYNGTGNPDDAASFSCVDD